VLDTKYHSKFVDIFRDLHIRDLSYMIDKFLGSHFSCLAVAFRPSNYLYHYNTQAKYVKLTGQMPLVNVFRRTVSSACRYKSVKKNKI
jgi:hypothetical protein